MKRLLFSLTALIALAFSPAAEENVFYRLKVEKFCELTVVDGVNVDYICNPDSAGWATFTATPVYASQITFSNNAEKLSIQTTADEAPIVGMPRITVYSGVLTKVENSGDSLVRVFNDIPAKSLKATQIGNGRLELHGINAENIDAAVAAGKGTLSINGKAGKAKIKNVGTGKIDASGLETKELKCLIFGTGDISCNPSEKLQIYGAGSGKVLYTATPDKITNRSIGVKSVSLGDSIPSENKPDVLTATRK